MVEYKCNKCEHKFCLKGDYERHINRKTSCTDMPKENADKYKCTICNSGFSTNSNMNKHFKKCKTVKESNEKEEERDKLFKFLLENKSALENAALLGKAQQVTNNNIDKQQINNIDKQQIINNNNIKLIAFGQEDMSYITDNICKQILSKGFQSVPKLIEHIHFNKDKPEYHNVYISNFRNAMALAFNGENWDTLEMDGIIDQLKDEKTDYIIEKFNEMKEQGKLSAAAIKKMERFISEKDEDPAESNLKKDIKFMLYNKRKMVTDTKKKAKQITEK
jgi:hypothetical protein